MESNGGWDLDIIEKLKNEIEKGGDLVKLPCPFCKLPRCSRSDYIRCSKCGINWLEDENLDHDPKIERFEKMKEERAKDQSSKSKK